MNRARILLLASIVLGVVAWASGCGDGATEPPPPVPPAPDPPRPTMVAVTPAAVELNALGATRQLTAQVLDQNGQPMAGATVTWASGAAGVATVNAAGLVTAAGNGTATITATAGGVSGTATVTVRQEVSTVAVSPAADTLVEGDTLRLAAMASDANGHAMAGEVFAWSSTDTLVARVDDAGLVAGVGAGEAQVTATSSGVTGSAALVVEVPAPTTVTLTPDTVELAALGDTVRLVAEVRDQIGRAVEGEAVSWSSGDTLVATVDSTGLVTAAGIGATTITATAGPVSGSAAVTVMQSAGTVVVSPLADTIARGDTLRLVAEAFDENGHLVEGADFTWSSNDGAVATVDASGLVRGIGEGTVTITATAGDARGTAEITVANPDRAALVALYHATDGPNWANNDNWLTDAPLGDWFGVEVEGRDRVTALYLYSNSLSGLIPPELGDLANPTRLSLSGNSLSGPIPPELGNLSGLETLWLSSNDLSGPIPSELGNLTRLESLQLGQNDLKGPIPSELGNLGNLTDLWLDNNNLSGPIPQSFLQLERLRDFHIAGNGSLCVPGTSPFVAWLRGIERHDGASTSCNAADVAALKSLFEAAGGTDWTESAGWLGDAVLEEWYGISADSLGRVVTLDLTRNGLAGRLPNNLGNLDEMTRLRIGDNALSGRLPLPLAKLSLTEFHYADTRLCAPAEASFQTWLSGIPSHEGTGVECAPLSDRDILVALYDAAGGPDWTHKENWLTDSPLGDWYGVYVDSEGRVSGLGLWANALAGSIPPELGNLTRLRSLRLGGTAGDAVRFRKVGNGLTGAIPPELGDLPELRSLSLGNNNLTGPIPAELGNLSNLQSLVLASNDLKGPIPAELGDLSNLDWLSLGHNDFSTSIPPELGELPNLTFLRLDNAGLTGSIPGELGHLSNLRELILERNELRGPVPPALGRLASLETLDLGRNGLSGPIPPELGRLPQLLQLLLSNNGLTGPVPGGLGALATLEVLELTNNAGMSGALPSSLTALVRLEALLAAGTGLCSPTNPGFLAWLEGIPKQRIASCADTGASQAYLTQVAQSREFPVPLVANRQALLRVFPTAREANGAGIPPVRASFYLNGTAVHAVDIPAKSAAIPTEVREGSLATSANAEIPASVVQPGLEMVVEIDPDGTRDAALGVTKRIPETGRMAIDVRAMPTLDMTLVPFLWSEMPDSSILDIVEGLSPEDELFWMTRTLLPVGDFDLAVHEPLLTSTNDVGTMHHESKAIWVMEGRQGHYVGTIAGEFTGPRGLGSLDTRVMFTVLGPTIHDPEYVLAHELGHTMSLLHTPCGGAGNQDPSYPYSNGSIGGWGYDFRDGGSLVAPHNRDLMSYCGTGVWWISDYHFTNALGYRLFDEGTPAASVAAPAKSLLLWGGVDTEDDPYLEPVFIVDAPAALPDSAGEYRLTGETADGRRLFSLSFTLPEAADGDGSSSFVFALPAQPAWAGNLAAVTLSGPTGSVTLDGQSDRPMAILRNARTGQVRGILRDLPPATQAARDAARGAAGPGLEVLFSRGIPDAAAWRP